MEQERLLNFHFAGRSSRALVTTHCLGHSPFAWFDLHCFRLTTRTKVSTLLSSRETIKLMGVSIVVLCCFCDTRWCVLHPYTELSRPLAVSNVSLHSFLTQLLPHPTTRSSSVNYFPLFRSSASQTVTSSIILRLLHPLLLALVPDRMLVSSKGSVAPLGDLLRFSPAFHKLERSPTK
jgi:hypothetical protein